MSYFAINCVRLLYVIAHFLLHALGFNFLCHGVVENAFNSVRKI